MTVLRAEYEGGSQVFVKQIDWLTKQGYAGIRRTRGDGTSDGRSCHKFANSSGPGDCFYRCEWRRTRRTEVTADSWASALAFAWIERMLLAADAPLAVTSAISALEASQPLLEAAGFQPLVFEDFYDCLVSLINQIIMPAADGRLLTPASLLEAFNSPESACACPVGCCREE